MTESAPVPDSATAADPSPGPSRAPVRVTVNGEVRLLDPGTVLDVLVAGLTAARSGVAAAVNESVVPRGQWTATALRDGDRVEILTAVQGG